MSLNQILVTEKIYLTPELKRKKKIYKFNFIISIFLICILCASYIYACYDKDKSVETSQMLLENSKFGTEDSQDSNLSLEEKMLIIGITDEDEYNIEEASNMAVEIEEDEPNQEELIANADTYVAPSGDTYSIIAKISIPKIDLELTILSKTTTELLKMSACKFWGVNPNEIGNMTIAGHNWLRKGVFFSDVPTLTNGDIIEITDLSGKTIQYSVYDKYLVDPKDTACTDPNTDGTREITLVTCNNDSSKRYVIKAREVL